MRGSAWRQCDNSCKDSKEMSDEEVAAAAVTVGMRRRLAKSRCIRPTSFFYAVSLITSSRCLPSSAARSSTDAAFWKAFGVRWSYGREEHALSVHCYVWQVRMMNNGVLLSTAKQQGQVRCQQQGHKVESLSLYTSWTQWNPIVSIRLFILIQNLRHLRKYFDTLKQAAVM